MRILIYAAIVLFAFRTAPAAAEETLPPILQGVKIQQRLGERIPLDLVFHDDAGWAVRLRDYFGSKPVVLVLAYYRCPKLCTEVLNGLEDGLESLDSFNIGREFNVLTVSFDPRETPDLAAAKKAAYIQKYGRPGAADGWHFLTGDETSIKQLTEAVGFHYNYDPRTDQFAHASGIMVLTPEGKLARYFYGTLYSPRDLRWGLVEASAGKIGSVVDQILLPCWDYDPRTGKYTLAVLSFVRLAGVVTLVALAAFFFKQWRGQRRAARERSTLAG